MELKRGLLKVVLFDKKDIDKYIEAGWSLVEKYIKKPIKENIEEIEDKPKHKSNKKAEIENKDSSII
jgi:hypothetical protein